MSLPRNKWIILAAIASLTVLAAWQCAQQGTALATWLQGNAWGRGIFHASLVLGGITLAELVWRLVLVLGYKPVDGCRENLLPTCTVIVPAFNEGEQVFETLRSIAASDYPAEKLHLIAVDDGSADDTWKWILKAKEVLREQVTTIRLSRNQGKRHALHAGLRRTESAVVVTVDSDSMVVPDTLRNLVSPFVADRRVGAVAGNVRVLNTSQGIIPRMLEVIFVYSFDFIRASQSRVRTVMCTPGALAAYRRDIVMEVLDEWLEQTFCGRPANIGEDRAMTNLIIRQGHHVVFQRNAVVFTEVPVKYANLCKMYLRWARSDIRETIAMSRFIFQPFRPGSKLGARINLILSWLTLAKIQVFLLVGWGLILLSPATFGLNVLCGIILSSGLAAAIYTWKFAAPTSLWAYPYGLYFFFSLSWITPYALFTPHKSGWLTRHIPNPPATAANRKIHREKNYGQKAMAGKKEAFSFPWI